LNSSGFNRLSETFCSMLACPASYTAEIEGNQMPAWGLIV